jgi:hypothetical protein
MNNSDSISLVQLPTEAIYLTVTYKPNLQGTSIYITQTLTFRIFLDILNLQIQNT